MEAKIYQTKEVVQRYQLFMNNTIEEGCTIPNDIYRCVYQMVSDKITISSKADAIQAIKRMYFQFNVTQPTEYAGRPVSKSDVIEIDGIHYLCIGNTWIQVMLK